MLTSDYPCPASTVTKQVYILLDINKVSGNVVKSIFITAKKFNKPTDEELDQLPVLPLVIARCVPNTKVCMIEALQRRDAFMAMTGDGVNDSPSLKIANSIVFIEATLFFAGIKAWKWGKRIFFRRRARKMGQTSDDLEKQAYGDSMDSSENGSDVDVPATDEKDAVQPS